ncbi:MAG: hypothetical protein WCW26_01545 [Candidatus Buchananbacteria bacterium]
MKKQTKKQKFYASFTSRWVFKLILNSWTLVTIFIFALDFFSGGRYNSSASAIGIIYLAILSLYAGEKEYTRWKNNFISCFLGEGFVVVWTAVLIIFALTAPLSEGRFKIPAELAVIYTSVVGVYIITKRSKSLRERKN